MPKRTVVGSPGWLEVVIAAEICPNQRLYRRLNRVERIKYGKTFPGRAVHKTPNPPQHLPESEGPPQGLPINGL